MLKEVIVVEGKSDIQQIAKAVELIVLLPKDLLYAKGYWSKYKLPMKKEELLFLPT